MSALDAYLGELGDALRVRGRRRRRIITECAEHLRDAAAERGEEAAVRRFGPPAELADAFDLEAAAGRAAGAAGLSLAGVALTALSTLVLIHAAAPGAVAATPVAIVFFVCAQVAGVAAGTAVAQALRGRRSPAEAPVVALLVRRAAVAIVAAGGTLLAAGVALPGHGSAPLLLAGPLALLVALVAVVRARRLARALPEARGRVTLSPLDTVPALDPVRHPMGVCAAVAAVAAVAAYARDIGEGSRPGAALVVALIEMTAVIGGFVVLGPALGLRPAATAAATRPRSPSIRRRP